MGTPYGHMAFCEGLCRWIYLKVCRWIYLKVCTSTGWKSLPYAGVDVVRCQTMLLAKTCLHKALVKLPAEYPWSHVQK